MSKIRMLKKEAQVALPNSGETYVAEDGTVSMVLDDEHDDRYEPSDQEIREYGEWLGMAFPADDELMWLAREGLKAPLPKEWKPCKTDTGEVYYFNFKTGDSIWDHPLDDYFKTKLKTEREKLQKKKEGIVEENALSKLPQRNNTIFSERGVIRSNDDDSSSANSDAPLSETKKPVASLNATASSVASLDREAATTLGANKMLSSAVSSKRDETFSKDKEKEAEKEREKKSERSTIPTLKDDDIIAEPKKSALSTSSKMPSASLVSSEPQKKSAIAASSLGVIKNALATEDLRAADDTPQESPRQLVSEGEKMLEVKINAELEAEMNKKIAELEAENQTEMNRVRRQHDEAVEELRATTEIQKKKIAEEAVEEVEDEFKKKKRQVETRLKKEIEQLQDEVDDIRAQKKRLEMKSSAGSAQADAAVEKAVSDAERDSKNMIQKKIRAIEDEIDELRIRHREQKKAALNAEREKFSKMALETSRTDEINADADKRIQNMKSNFELTKKKYVDAMESEIAEATVSAMADHRSATGTIVQEILKKQEEEVKAIRRDSDALIARLEQEHTVTLQRLDDEFRTKTDALKEGDQKTVMDADMLAAVESDKQRRLREVEAEHEEALEKQRREHLRLRAEKIAAASAEVPSASTDDIESEIASARARVKKDLEERMHTLQKNHDKEMSELSKRTADATRRAEESKKEVLQFHVDKEVQRQLATFVRETEARREEEARAWSARRDEVLRLIEEQQARAAKAATSRAIASVESPKRAAIARAKCEADNRVHVESRKLREKHTEDRSAKALALVDEIASLERSRRREIDQKYALLRAQTQSSAKVDDVSDVPSSDDEAAVRRELKNTPPLNVETEVARRLVSVREEFARREEQLRREIAATFSAAAMSVGIASHRPSQRAPTTLPIRALNTDPVALRVSREQVELQARQAALNHARQQWEIDVGGPKGAPSHTRQPANPSEQVLGVLHTLSSRLDNMNTRIEGISPTRKRR